jgi:hypothetical protein
MIYRSNRNKVIPRPVVGVLIALHERIDSKGSRENSQSSAKNQLPIEKVILAFHGCRGATGDVRRF